MDRRVTLHKHREVLTDVFAPSSPAADNIMLQTLPPQYPSPGPSILVTIPADEIKQEVTAEMLLEDLENMDNVNVKQELLTPNSESLEASSSMTCYGTTKRKRKDDDRESDTTSEASRKRKRAVSWTSSVHSDMVSDGRRTPKETKPTATLPLENKRTPKKAKVQPGAIPSPTKGLKKFDSGRFYNANKEDYIYRF